MNWRVLVLDTFNTATVAEYLSALIARRATDKFQTRIFMHFRRSKTTLASEFGFCSS